MLRSFDGLSFRLFTEITLYEIHLKEFLSIQVDFLVIMNIDRFICL